MGVGLLWLVVLVAMEIWSIIQVSHYVGALATLVLLVAGVIFGLQLMRAQGLGAMMKAAQNVPAGESPLGPLAEGIVTAFAGILLIIPGFISDLLALIILLPFIRKIFARHLAKKGQFQGFAGAGFGAGGFGMGGFGGFGKASANDSFAGGNVYEHEGSVQSAAAIKAERVVDAEVLEAQVIELKPKQKPQDR